MKLVLLVAAAALAAFSSFRTASHATDSSIEPAGTVQPAGKPAGAGAAAATTYTVDPVHSSVLFRVKHMGVSAYWGRFNTIQGKLVVDEADPAACSVALEVDASSVDTANADRDKHLSGPDFFNVKQFPKIAFQSKKIAASGDGYSVEGELDLHGTKKPVKVAMTKIGQGPGFELEPLIGFEGRFKINRSEFGVEYGLPDAISDEVEILVSIEAAAAKK